MAVIITGNNTPTAGGVTYGDGSTYANTAAGTAGQILQSNGSGAPTWVTFAGYTSVDIQSFTSSGTWTKPAGANIVVVEIWGSGGGGAGGTNVGSGGGGAYVRKTYTASSLDATEAVTIGSGGAGSSSGSAAAGGASTFKSLSAGGGGGGTQAGTGGGAGGTASGGDLNISGQSGGGTGATMNFTLGGVAPYLDPMSGNGGAPNPAVRGQGGRFTTGGTGANGGNGYALVTTYCV